MIIGIYRRRKLFHQDSEAVLGCAQGRLFTRQSILSDRVGQCRGKPMQIIPFLDEIIGCSRFERGDRNLLIALPCNEHHGGSRLKLLDFCQKVQAGAIGQTQVGQDQVNIWLSFEHFQRRAQRIHMIEDETTWQVIVQGSLR
jgi:hypothetical protein